MVSEITALGKLSGLSVDPQGRLNYSLSSFQNPVATTGVYRVNKDFTQDMWSDADGFDLDIAGDGTAYVAGRNLSRNIIRIAPTGIAEELTPFGLQWLYVGVNATNSRLLATTTGGLYDIDLSSGTPTLLPEPSATLFGFLAAAFTPNGVPYFSVGNSFRNLPGIYRLDANLSSLAIEIDIAAFDLAADSSGGFTM